MTAPPSTMAAVGRKRQPQSKDIARTMAGRFGARLAYLADRRGITAKELGEKIGKSPQMVRLYYSGKVVPHIDDWPTLARAVGLKSIAGLLPE